jgi:hypothetical protein
VKLVILTFVAIVEIAVNVEVVNVQNVILRKKIMSLK